MSEQPVQPVDVRQEQQQLAMQQRAALEQDMRQRQLAMREMVPRRNFGEFIGIAIRNSAYC